MLKGLYMNSLTKRFWSGGAKFIPAIALLSAVAVLSTCAVDQEVRQADKSIAYAKKIHSEYLAPYEFRSAEVYLDEAREQLNRSAFTLAGRDAQKAKDQAAAATLIASAACICVYWPIRSPSTPSSDRCASVTR